MKYIIAGLIYLASFGLYLSLSGAPIRVYLVSALGLLIGFFIPAILVRNRKELKEKKGIWAYYPIDNEFELKADSANELLEGYINGTITV